MAVASSGSGIISDDSSIAGLDATTRSSARRDGAVPVVVCVSSMGPDPEALIRYASRLAQQLGQEWFALHVETATELPLREGDGGLGRVERTFGVAKRLGGTPFRYRADDVAGAILRFAREVGAGHVVVGRSARRAWWWRLLGREDLLSCLLRRAEGLTVVVVDPRGREVLRRRSRGRRVGSAPRRTPPTPSVAELLAGGEVVLFDSPVLREQAAVRLLETLGQRQPGIDVDELLPLAGKGGRDPIESVDEHGDLVHLVVPGIGRPVAALGVLRMALERGRPATGLLLVLLSPGTRPDAEVLLRRRCIAFLRDPRLRRRLQSSLTAEDARSAALRRPEIR